MGLLDDMSNNVANILMDWPCCPETRTQISQMRKNDFNKVMILLDEIVAYYCKLSLEDRYLNINDDKFKSRFRACHKHVMHKREAESVIGYCDMMQCLALHYGYIYDIIVKLTKRMMRKFPDTKNDMIKILHQLHNSKCERVINKVIIF